MIYLTAVEDRHVRLISKYAKHARECPTHTQAPPRTLVGTILENHTSAWRYSGTCSGIASLSSSQFIGKPMDIESHEKSITKDP